MVAGVPIMVAGVPIMVAGVLIMVGCAPIMVGSVLGARRAVSGPCPARSARN
jgi:hypothetical protein